MADDVTFIDNSIQVKAEINDATIAWLYEVAGEIASRAKRECTTDQEYSSQLRNSYDYAVDEQGGTAEIGSPMEQAFWEEWGTGTFAEHGDGRKGWWVYVKGSSSGTGGKSYDSQEDAEKAAAFLRSKGLDAYATNGRKPNYTLQKAFESYESMAKERLAEIVGEELKDE